MKLKLNKFANSLDKLRLQSLFEEFGEVSSVKIFRSAGAGQAIGFVDMPEDRDALRALEMLTGEIIDGIALGIEMSRDVFSFTSRKSQQKRKKYSSIEDIEDDIPEEANTQIDYGSDFEVVL